MLFACSVLAFIMAYPLFMFLRRYPNFWGLLVVQATAQAVLTLYTGVISTILSEMFPTNVRYTALSVSYGFAVAIFGGFAPYISTFLVRVTGDVLAPSYYVMAAGLGERHRGAVRARAPPRTGAGLKGRNMANIVLIHGAYQGGWIWQRVVSRLAAAGHRCSRRRSTAAPNAAMRCGPASPPRRMARRSPNCCSSRICATSCWWAPAAAAWWCAARRNVARERIGRLVFADALALFDGECIPDIVKRPTAVTTDLTTGPSREDAAGADVREPRRCDEGLGAGALHAASGGGDARSGEAAGLLAADMEGERDLVSPGGESGPGAPASRRRSLGATWHELDTGHYPMLTAADELSRLIVAG